MVEPLPVKEAVAGSSPALPAKKFVKYGGVTREEWEQYKRDYPERGAKAERWYAEWKAERLAARLHPHSRQ